MSSKIGVLFVCLGNICRSPAAEAVFRSSLAKRGWEQHFDVDSAGTSSHHEGDPADARMQESAHNRGLNLTSLSRPLKKEDFSRFHYILAMDDSNLRHCIASQPKGTAAQIVPMVQFCRIHQIKEVPDPYYKALDGFELVLDILEDAIDGFASELEKSHPHLVSSTRP